MNNTCLLLDFFSFFVDTGHTVVKHYEKVRQARHIKDTSYNKHTIFWHVIIFYSHKNAEFYLWV